MDLQQFVSVTLRQIMDGVKDAKEYGKTIGAEVNPEGLVMNYPGMTNAPLFRQSKSADGNHTFSQFAKDVVFDVALTTTEENTKAGGASIAVVGIALGGKLQTETTNSSVSRVQFTVPVFFP